MKVLLFILICFYTRNSDGVNVQFQSKITTGIQNDWFGRSVAANDKILVVGAPLDDNGRGSVYIYDIQANHSSPVVKIESPTGKRFGFNVAVNKDFILATTQGNTYLYIFVSTPPYKLVTYLYIGYWYEPYGLSISEGNDIAVASTTYSDHSTIVYVYNWRGPSPGWKGLGRSWWVKSRYIWTKGGSDLGEHPAVTIHNDTLAAGFPGSDDWTRGIYVLTKSTSAWTGVWKDTDILRPQQDLWHFGGSIMGQGNTLVASARSYNGSMDLVFVYKRDAGTGKWLADGDPFVPPGAPHSGSLLPAGVALGNNMLFVTISDKKSFPDVMGVVYKRVTKGNNVVWKEHIALRTEGEPLLSNQYNAIVRCHGNRVFVTRTDRHGFGAVYMFDLSSAKRGDSVVGTPNVP